MVAAGAVRAGGVRNAECGVRNKQATACVARVNKRRVADPPACGCARMSEPTADSVAQVTIGEPRWFRLREVLIITAGAQVFGSLVGGATGAGMALVVWSCASVDLSLARAGTGALILSLVVGYFLPLGCGSLYIVRLVRRHIPRRDEQGAVFIVQLTLRPRLYRGVRGWLEDADDVGVLNLTDNAAIFTGDHVALSLPYRSITRISDHNVGKRGLWVCGRRIRVSSPQLPQYEYIEFMERAAMTIGACNRTSRDILNILRHSQPAEGE